MSTLDYTALIVTRNRPSALLLSIPRILGQSRPPAQLVVIDSSDDHGATRDAVKEAVGGHPVELVLQHSGPGMTYQRNIGLGFVRHPVVCFPDDDSIWFPGVAEAKLSVYEKDTERVVVAVCAAESPTPPEGFEAATAAMYSMRKRDKVQQRLAHTRAKLERTFAPEPAHILGKGFWHGVRVPDWFVSDDVVLVEFMTGFRMSFRTDVIRKVRFEERFTKYSLFEDIHASFGAWRYGAVVGARRAKIFHYKSPERRDNGRRLGVLQLLNKACVVASNSPVGDPSRKAMLRFAKYKILQYSMGRQDQFGKERHAGAKEAMKELPGIVSVRPEEVFDAYEAALARCMDGHSA